MLQTVKMNGFQIKYLHTQPIFPQDILKMDVFGPKGMSIFEARDTYF